MLYAFNHHFLDPGCRKILVVAEIRFGPVVAANTAFLQTVQPGKCEILFRDDNSAQVSHAFNSTIRRL